MKEQQKNRNIGVISSVIFHVLLLMVFFFMVAWQAPNPPLPNYGIELMLGVEPNEEPTDTADEQDTQEDTDTPPETSPSDDEIPVENSNSVEKSESSATEGNMNTDEPVIKKINKTTAPKKKREEKKKKPKKIDNPESSKKSIVKNVKKKTPKKTKKPNAIYTVPKVVEENKGSKEGSLDAKAIYEHQGGGNNGVGLDLAGWDWDHVPKPPISNEESAGKIEFEITVDHNGELIGYKILERSLSIEAERSCREAISNLTFTQKPGMVIPDISVGKIVFVVRAR